MERATVGRRAAMPRLSAVLAGRCRITMRACHGGRGAFGLKPAGIRGAVSVTGGFKIGCAPQMDKAQR